MAHSFDVVIIGAGHNSLTTAAYLAKAGKKVLVLEKRDAIGGVTSNEDAPNGFKFNSVLDSAAGFRRQIVRELGLQKFGLEFLDGTPAVFAPQPDGNGLTLWHDPARTEQGLAAISKNDTARWADFSQMLTRIVAFLEAVYWTVPPRVTEVNPSDLATLLQLGLKLKALGNHDMMEAVRLLPMSVYELLNDWFENDQLKGAMGAAGIHGLTQGVRASGTALMLLHNLAGTGRVVKSVTHVRGGIGQLATALASAAQAHGAQIRTSASVERIMVREGKVTGVALSDGEEIRSAVVASGASPRHTFCELVEAQHLGPDFIKRVGNIRMRGSVAKVNLALSGLPHFDGATDELLASTICIAPSLDYLERAYDDAKYGRYSLQPYMEVVIPSLVDRSLAPEGKHVMSIHIQFAPYHLRQSNWDQERDALGDTVLRALAPYAPDLQSLVEHRQVLTPLDLERAYGLTEGSILHGEIALDQFYFMRPVPEYARYQTPVRGLYLCGAGAHGGGGVSGLAGYHAARQVFAGE